MTAESTMADVRFALRLMRRSPLFTALAMGALALGIGATGAIFAAVNAVLVRPLPYARPAELVMVWSNNTNAKSARNPVSPADYLDLKSMTGSFAAIEAAQSFFVPEQFSDGGEPVAIQSSLVTTGLFDALGRPPLLGRLFQPNDRQVVLLSHGFWQRRYGGDRSVVGRTVDINGVPISIVGVMPPDFIFPYRTMMGPSGFTRAQSADVWEPIQFQGRFFVNADGSVARQIRFLALIGRLKEGKSAGDARSDLAAITTSLAKAYPATNDGWLATVVPLHEQAVGATKPALLLLFAGVAVLWLMACANVANLLLARSIARRNEVAVRRALGATRWRLARQTLVEGLLLAAGGGLGGVLLLYIGIPVLVALAPPDTPRVTSIAPDLTVFAFMFVLASATGIATALVPAIAAANSDVHSVLKDAGRGATMSPARKRVRAALVVGEIALAVLLTTGATLLVRSFVSLMGVDPGFSVDRLLTFQINAPRLPNQPALLDYYDRLFAALDALPGVASTGGTTRVPLGSTNVSTLVSVEGRDIPAAQLPEVEFRRALNNYFAAMGMPIVRGRGFTRDDALPNASQVCVINHAMQLRLFPDEDPVGRRVRMGTTAQAPWITIVGVVGDVRHSSLEEAPKSELYISGHQNPPNSPYIAIRAQGDPGALADAARRVVRSIDAQTPIYDMRTMASMKTESVSERKFVLTLASVFGVLALLLATCGVYGVMALIVSERTPEVGVRVALGATRTDILGLIVGQSARLGLIGVAIGMVAALVLAPLMASQLFGVKPLDIVTFAVVPLVLMAAAVVAACVPARRAMQVDPVVALRNE